MNTLPSKLDEKNYLEHIDVARTINSIISFLEEKFPKPDEPKKCAGYSPSPDDVEAPFDCLNCGEIKSAHTPHWESDYAVIWERYWTPAGQNLDDVRQDILELIRKVAK